MIKVLSVDDHALLREGIAALVKAESDMKLVAEWIRLRDGVKSPVTRDYWDASLLRDFVSGRPSGLPARCRLPISSRGTYAHSRLKTRPKRI